MTKSVIFGAGKIGRGFIAHLLYLENEPFCFVEKYTELASALNAAGEYTVHVLGNPAKDIAIRGVKTYAFDQAAGIANEVAQADCIFTSVGGKNLLELVPVLAAALRSRFTCGIRRTMNIITCENWKRPADLIDNALRSEMGELLPIYESCVGVAESVVLRSGIENPEDPLAVNSQDYWELPINALRLKAELPKCKAFKPMSDFEGYLERKFHTYNAANATVSYLGSLLKYTYISDAAHDPFILEVLEGVYSETSQALCRKQGFPNEEQKAFTRSSLAKLQDRVIVDMIERNARDPIRKLAPDDRLQGPARMALDYGIVPRSIALVIAAAVYYENDSDEYAAELKQIRLNQGIEEVFRQICKLTPEDPLTALILQGIAELRKRGLIYAK